MTDQKFPLSLDSVACLTKEAWAAMAASLEAFLALTALVLEAVALLKASSMEA